MPKVIGIDLGTTNSVIAVMEGGEPVVIPNAEGSRLTPSVVAVNPKTGERMVGQVAKRQAITNPDNTIFSIKRFMGRKFDDPTVEQDKKLRALQDERRLERRRARRSWGTRRYSPQEVSAMILQKLKTDAEAYLGEAVDPGSHHGPGLLQRQPAPGDQRRGHDRRAGSAADHQRADGLLPRLRARQEEGRGDRRL